MSVDVYLQSLHQNNPNICFLYAVLGNLCFSFMNIFFKILTAIGSPLQIFFFRALTLFTFNIWVLGDTKSYISSSKMFKMVMLRVFCTSGSLAITQYCVKYLPVSIVSTLYNTSPIFVYFVEALYYKKPFNKISLLLTMICFCGVLLIVQPNFIFTGNSSLDNIENLNLLVALMLMSSVMIGMGLIFVHDTSKHIPLFVNLHYSYMGHMFLCAMYGNFDSPRIEFDSLNIYYALVFIGAITSSLASQYLTFAANSLVKPSKVMPFGYVSVVSSFIADIYLFQVQFNAWGVLGVWMTSLGLVGKFLVEKHGGGLRRSLSLSKMNGKQQQLVKI